MTKKEYRKLYYHIFGSTHLRREFWMKHRDMLRTLADAGGCAQYFITTEGQIYMKEHEKNKATQAISIGETWPPLFPLGNCEAATPCVPAKLGYPVPQEKGNNPMRIENTTATAYITAEKSSDAVIRDYLTQRLQDFAGWRSPKLMELQELFNLDETGLPKTHQQLIDAIKGGKFTLDEKKLNRLKEDAEDQDMPLDEYMAEYSYGPFYAVTFTDLPKADRKGYDAALTEWNKQVQATKDIIVTRPADGLAAFQALEAWLPAGKAN